MANLVNGFGVDEIYARTDATSSSYFLTDALNSTVGLADSNGNLSTQYSYDPFGNTQQSSGSSSNAFQYTGRENDGTGLYYLRARYYSPLLGRFISQDPIGFADGINLYAYAANNPMSLIDPFGKDPGVETGTTDPNTGIDNMLFSDTVYATAGGSNPSNNDPPPLFTPTDIFNWIPPIKPRFCFNDAFGYVGAGAKIPYTNIHAEFYLIPADYESGKGLSSGVLLEAEIPHTPIAIGAERSYNWKSGTWSTEALAFANKDAGSARLGAVNIGALADQHGNVGVYGGVGPVGGGITFRFSLFGCD